jgi:hypothetical protein
MQVLQGHRDLLDLPGLLENLVCLVFPVCQVFLV